jgi:hypothetical protein
MRTCDTVVEKGLEELGDDEEPPFVQLINIVLEVDGSPTRQISSKRTTRTTNTTA